MGLGEKASCVMGNHEFKAIRQQRDWLLAMGDRRIRWLESCPHILRVGRLGAMGEVVVVHAGLEPGRKLERQRPRDVMNMRVIDKHGTPDSRKEGVDWFEVLEAPPTPLIRSSALKILGGQWLTTYVSM